MRQSGRTTKILQEALTHVLSGESVFFVVTSSAMIPYCIAIVKNIHNDAKIDKRRNAVRLKNTFELKFILSDDYRLKFENGDFRVVGSRGRVFVDHYVFEQGTGWIG